MRVFRFSLSTQVFLGLSAGLLAGILFGKEAGRLTVIGDAFIQLLQMTVLPYITLSLITALGPPLTF
jgi:Na+/H+-dicarboxylate symporter